MGVANDLGEIPFDLQNEESGFRCFNTIFANNILDTLELMELDGQEEGVFLKGDAAQRGSSIQGRAQPSQRGFRRGGWEATWKGGSRDRPFPSGLPFPGGGLGPRETSPRTDPASAKGSARTPGAHESCV